MSYLPGDSGEIDILSKIHIIHLAGGYTPASQGNMPGKDYLMKMHFEFNMSAESGKITTDGLTAELGRIDCPINVELEFEASEIQQTLGLCKELIAKVPSFIKEAHTNDMELAEHRAKLEADNIRLRADLADQASKTAHLRAVDLVRLKAEIEHHDIPAETDTRSEQAEPAPDRATGRKHTKV